MKKQILIGFLTAFCPRLWPGPRRAQGRRHRPDFTASRQPGRQGLKFSLKDALKKGPVVVYFYPAPLPAAATCKAPHLRRRIRQVHRAPAPPSWACRATTLDRLHKFSADPQILRRTNSRWHPMPAPRSRRPTNWPSASPRKSAKDNQGNALTHAIIEPGHLCDRQGRQGESRDVVQGRRPVAGRPCRQVAGQW